MPDPTRASCKRCHRHRDTVGGISWSGLCIDCAKARVGENVEGLMLMRGEPLQRWRRGMIACAGGVMLDAPKDHGQTRGDA
jgi:hypothetical protein